MKWLTATDICVVTGGNNGLGAAILKELARFGCQTVSIDITPVASPAANENMTPENLTASDLHYFLSIEEAQRFFAPAAAAAAASKGGRDEEDLRPSLVLSCDVRNTEDLKSAREKIYKKFGRHPSVLVLNAGVRQSVNSIADTKITDMEAIIDVNLLGVLRCIRTFMPDIIESKRGFILSIASALGILVPKGFGVYGASKAGLIGLHEALERELADYDDIHSMVVCPGQLDTNMFSDVTTPSELLAPIVPPSKLAQKIVKRISKAKSSTLYAPAYVRYLPLLHSMPVPIANLLRRFSGVDTVYDRIKADEARKNTASAEEERQPGKLVIRETTNDEQTIVSENNTPGVASN